MLFNYLSLTFRNCKKLRITVQQNVWPNSLSLKTFWFCWYEGQNCWKWTLKPGETQKRHQVAKSIYLVEKCISKQGNKFHPEMTGFPFSVLALKVWYVYIFLSGGLLWSWVMTIFPRTFTAFFGVFLLFSVTFSELQSVKQLGWETPEARLWKIGHLPPLG